MSMLGPRLVGARILDLFAGSGALGLEALSRGAAHATFVEKSRRVVRLLRRNIAHLGAGELATVLPVDALGHVRCLGVRHYDLALADPPYGQGYARAVLSAYAQTPFARELWLEHGAGELTGEDGVLDQRVYGDVVLSRVMPDRTGTQRGHA